MDYPIKIIEILKHNLIRDYSSNIFFNFSKYVYAPNSYIDEREEIKVNINNFNETFISNLLNDLQYDEELAINSNINLGDKVYHLPMIDFASNSLTKVKEAINKNFSNTNYLEDYYLLDSGRSYHFYSLILIDEVEWRKFMGSLLLMNNPSENHISDTRWIGHRLIAGYCALRLSKNTNRYLQTPKIIFDSKSRQLTKMT